MVHDVLLSIHQQKQMDLIPLDFSKAFDRVSLSELIIKLQLALGKAKSLEWITDFLAVRLQFLEINHVQSSVVPVIFLLFVNDLPSFVNVGCRLFADDCILYKEINSYYDHIAFNAALEPVSAWCNGWQMHINKKKLHSYP